MKKICFALVALSTLNVHLSTAQAQGSLTPSGPPGPAMRTLLQIEPRTPISSLPYTITAPGAYFVTTNLVGVANTNGITIATSNVVLDLRGFTLQGVAGSSSGIFVVEGGLLDITIENGSLVGWGFRGIHADFALNARFIRLNLVGNSDDGMDCGQYAQVLDCQSHNNVGAGFGGAFDSKCRFEGCTANDDLWGFFTSEKCEFVNCVASDNFSDGINPWYDCQFQNCVATGNSGNGIYSPASGCVCCYNGQAGIVTGDNCAVRDSSASNNGDDGIDTGNSTLIDSCTASQNSSGGISASNFCTINDSAAGTNQLDNIITGSGCAIGHSSAGGSVTGSGFVLGSGNTITGSSAVGNAVYGISAGDRTTALQCTANFNGTAGILAEYLSNIEQCSCFNNGVYGILSDANGFASVLQNNCSFNGLLTPGGTPTQGAGIYITNSPGCRIEGNTLNINFAALVVAPNNHAFILRNSAEGSFSTAYSLGAGNSWGPIVNVSAGGDISGIANSSHPEANFIH